MDSVYGAVTPGRMALRQLVNRPCGSDQNAGLSTPASPPVETTDLSMSARRIAGGMWRPGGGVDAEVAAEVEIT